MKKEKILKKITFLGGAIGPSSNEHKLSFDCPFDIPLSPLFELPGGPGGGNLGRDKFLSTGFNVGISPAGKTNLAPAEK